MDEMQGTKGKGAGSVLRVHDQTRAPQVTPMSPFCKLHGRVIGTVSRGKAPKTCVLRTISPSPTTPVEGSNPPIGHDKWRRSVLRLYMR